MSKIRRRSMRINIFMYFVLIHTFLSTLFVLFLNYKHPLTGVLKGPLWFQVAILSMVALVVYVIASIIFAASKRDKKPLRLGLERGAILFSLLLLAVYAIVYFLSQQFYNRELMLIYCIANPWFGTFIYKIPGNALYSLWWMISTVVPGLGIYMGSRIYLSKWGK